MDYRKLTRNLIKLLHDEREAAAQLANKIGELEQQLVDSRANAEESMYAADEASSRAYRQIQQARNDARDAEMHAEDERSRIQSDLRSATDDLARARSWGDEWAEQRALDRIKRLT